MRTRALRSRLIPDRQSPAANVLRLLLGNASAQVLTLAAYPILTRLYTPAQIGVLSALTAAVLVLAPAASLRIEMALPTARNEREGGSLLAASALALLATTLALAVLMTVLPSNWPGEMAAAAPYRWFLPLAHFAMGSFVIMFYEATRRNRFAEISRARVMQAFNGPAGQIGFHFIGLGTFGLLLAYVIGQCSGTVGLVWRLLRGQQSPLRQVRWRSIRAAVSRHRQFVLFSSWTGVISAASSFVMTIAFAFIYGPAVSGFMFLGERVVMRPLELISLAVLPVYTQQLAQMQGTGHAGLERLFVSAVRKQALLALAWLLPIAIAAPWVIPWAFGAQWADAARFLQILAIGYFPTSVLHPVINTLPILREQKLLAALDIGRSAAVFAAIGVVAALGLPPLTGVLVCSLTQAASQLVVLWLTWRRVRALSRATPASAASVTGANNANQTRP